MNAFTIIVVAGMLLVSICSFIYLAVVLIQNWRNNERIKGSPFHVMDEGISFGRVPPHHDCFDSCMSRNAWDVDRTPVCALECKKPNTAAKAATSLAASGA